jgi:hypothetical protein
VAVLDMKPDRLAMMFRSDPWVEEVVKVSYLPGKIRVQLRFAEPVAWVKLPKGDQQLVDERGVLLAADDVDPVALGPLIRIGGAHLTPPADPQPGVIWKSKNSPGELEQTDESIVAAARLAGFLRRKRLAGGASNSKPLMIIEINVSNFEKSGLFVVNGERTMIRWGYPSADEHGANLGDEAKWGILGGWQQSTTKRALPIGDYWGFGEKVMQHLCPHGDPAHQPREVGEPEVAPKQTP